MQFIAVHKLKGKRLNVKFFLFVVRNFSYSLFVILFENSNKNLIFIRIHYSSNKLKLFVIQATYESRKTLFDRTLKI
jgi:hypothetical protein